MVSGPSETRWDKGRVIAFSPTSGERKVVIDGGSDAQYVSTGHLLYAVGGAVYAVPFDIAALALRGPATAVIQGVRRSTVTGAAQFDVSRNGTLAYVPGPLSLAVTDRRLGFLDRSGATAVVDVPPGGYETPRLAPDGTRIALGNLGESTADIWIYDLSGSSALRRLTFGGRNRFPVWSPDGRQVVFQSDRDGDAGLFVQSADGSGTAARLTTPAPGTLHVPDSWSPDGRWLLLTSVTQRPELSILSLADRTIRSLAGSSGGSGRIGGVFSPDGRWIAYYEIPRFGDLVVFVEPFPATGAKHQIRAGIHPVWATDGRELFTTPSQPEFVSFRITAEPVFTFREGDRISREGVVGSTPTGVRNYEVMPDGKRLLVVLGGTGEAREVRVVLNWFEELKKQ